jgi:hypothetical protein
MAARSEVAKLKQALAVLPMRWRVILKGIAIEGRSAEDLAKGLKMDACAVEADVWALQRCVESPSVAMKNGCPCFFVSMPFNVSAGGAKKTALLPCGQSTVSRSFSAA